MANANADPNFGSSKLRELPLLPSKDTVGPFFTTEQDLISLVEKGRVGISSNSSCCSSNTSSVGEKHEDVSRERSVTHLDDMNLR